MKLLFICLFSLFLVACTSQTEQADPYAAQFNFTYTTSVYNLTLEYNNITDPFAQGDALLIEARIHNTDPRTAIPYYKKALQTASPEEKALLYESIASIENKREYYWTSYFIWKQLGNDFHAQTDWYLLYGLDPPYKADIYELPSPYFATSKNATEITIGETSFTLNKSDILISQVDRVTRDWLSSQLQNPETNNLLTVFSEKYDVENIGWHEGGRITQYKKETNLTHIPATGTLVRKINGTWYAANENGTFMFDVPIDKVEYPTTRFFNENLGMIIDTHGVNMLVEQAINDNATVVMACCDHIGKIKAALYLNERGIKVICNTDKYLPLALGQTNTTLGSAPFYPRGNTLLFGNQSINISLNEKIIVLNATEKYGLSYYATPTIYFTTLQKRTLLPLDMYYINIDNYNQMQKVVNKAHEENASVIAARVYNEDDYSVLSAWLQENESNRLILFHSEAYPYGYLLLRNYPKQITFDDIMPKFK
ncbi:hypothetical protein HZA98_01715 [Candidatus Woesearchaeota archaeon]|nr:hypothetical protein [Candidatus Woesearchaeota archaeon]